MKKNTIKIIAISITIFLTLLLFVKLHNVDTPKKPKIGIAWITDKNIEFYKNVFIAVKKAGGEPIALDQVINNDLKYTNNMISDEGINENDYLDLSYANIVKNTEYKNTNVEKVLNDIDAVIFSGGEDISPSLYKNVVDWHHIETEKSYNPTRDVSDYILMSYCLDKNIPIMGICRGMQMLSVVSGCEIIQDIPTFFHENGLRYNNEFRQVLDDTNNDYATPSIDIIDKNSKIYDICNTNKIQKIPSWHHQAVKNINNTNLKVTAICKVDNYDIIEAVERVDKKMAIGFQFHPEKAIIKNDSKNADKYMNHDTALKIFSYFIKNNDVTNDSKNINNTTAKIHSINLDKNIAYFDGKKINEYDYVWHIDSKGDYKDVKDSPAEYYTGDKPDETNEVWIAHDIKYFPMIDKSKFYKTTVKNDPEWGTNYENEKYKDFVFANLPRSYEGDDFPEYMMHNEDEAYNNPCLHISTSGTYELSGKWNGQIFVDLGKDSITNPDKRINLILNNLEVNCSVASAINIYRAYECDNKWEERKESTKDIDLKDTGVNIIIKDNSKNIINGANVYRIKKATYKKDSKEQKTAIKYDGAIESNITFSIDSETQNNGELYVNAVLEGISSSLHLAINGGKIYINADNDGINCNEDNVSIIEINDCYLMVNAGLSYQGDGIDSNGYIVMNDGDIVTIGNYNQDPGIDATKGLFINGGKIIALGQPDNIDWPKIYTNENTDQSFVFKSFDDAKSENSRIFVVDENGTEILNFSETDIPHINDKKRPFFATLISNPDIKKNKKYDVIIEGPPNK